MSVTETDIPMKSLGYVIIDLTSHKEIIFIVHELDWQFGAFNFKGYFDRNFFDRDRQNCLNFRKIGIIFTMN